MWLFFLLFVVLFVADAVPLSRAISSPPGGWVDVVLRPSPAVLVSEDNETTPYYIDTRTPMSFKLMPCKSVPECANKYKLECSDMFSQQTKSRTDIFTREPPEDSVPYVAQCSRNGTGVILAYTCQEDAMGILGILPEPAAGCATLSPIYSMCSEVAHMFPTGASFSCSSIYTTTITGAPDTSVVVLDLPRFRLGMFKNISHLVTSGAPFLRIAHSEVMPGAYLSNPRAVAQAMGYFYVRAVHLCDADLSLINGPSVGWQATGSFAVVDTLKPCVYLPAEFYVGVIAWLQLKCNTTSPKDLCTLPPSYVWGSALPHLILNIAPTFGGGSGGSQNISNVHIDLTNLVIRSDDNPNTQSYQLCLRSSGSISEFINGMRRMARSAFVDRNPPPIVIGYMALATVVVVYDRSTMRVGLHSEPTVNSQLQCAPRVTCRGEQTYDTVRNFCKHPECSSKFFEELDETEMRCVIPSSLWVGLFGAVAVFVVLETLLSEYSERLTRRVRNTRHAIARRDI